MSDRRVTVPGERSDSHVMTRGSTALALGQTIARVAAFAFLLVATRELTPNEFGRYSIVAALILVVQIVSDAGTTVAITKHLSGHPEDSDALLSGTALTSVALGFAGYALALAFVVAVHYPPVTLGDMAIAGIALPFDALLTSVIGALDARGRMMERATVSALRTGLVAVLGAGALLLGSGVRGPIVATAVVPVVLLAATVPLARRWRIWWSRPRVDVGRSVTLLRRAMPFALVGVINVLILRFDVVLVSLLTTRSHTAIYDVATRSIEGVAYLGAVLGAPLMVVLSRRYAAGDRAGSARVFASTCRVAWFAGLALCAVLVGTRTTLVPTLFGARYDGAAVPLALLALQLPLLFITGLQGTALAADDDERGLVLVSAWVGAAVVALDLVVVPIFAATGAAAVMVAVRIVAIVLFTVRLRRTVRVSTPLPPVGAVIAAVVAAAVADRVAPWGLLPSAGAGVVVFGGVLILLRTVRVSELRDLRETWAQTRA